MLFKNSFKNPYILISLLSLVILVGFITYYMVPPLHDFQNHVALGMVKGSVLSQYYVYQPALTYRLLDTIVRFWSMFAGYNFAVLALLSYLTSLLLIFSTICVFLYFLNLPLSRILYCVAILAGPIFLLLHSASFLAGGIPFILAAFMASASSIVLWSLDKEIINHAQRRKTFILFAAYTILAIYSHPAGCLFLLLSWLVPALRFVLIKGERKKRFVLFAVVFLVVIMAGYFGSSASNTEVHSTLYTLFLNSIKLSGERIQLLFIGGAYVELIQTLTSNSLTAKIIGIGFSLVTYLVLVSLLFCVFIKKNRGLLVLATSQLIFFLIIDLFVPNGNWGEFQGVPFRFWMLVSAWTFMGMAYVINKFPDHLFKIICCLSPLGVALSCAILQPLYSANRQMPIENIAAQYSHYLYNAVTTYREKYPEMAKKKVIVVDFPDHWGLHTTVPFLMVTSPELVNNNIFIKHRWTFADHLPLGWKEGNNHDPHNFLLNWEGETANSVILKPLSRFVQVNKTYSMNDQQFYMETTGFSNFEAPNGGRWTNSIIASMTFYMTEKELLRNPQGKINFYFYPQLLPGISNQNIVVYWGKEKQLSEKVATAKWLHLPYIQQDWQSVAENPGLRKMKIQFDVPDATVAPSDPRLLGLYFLKFSITSKVQERNH